MNKVYTGGTFDLFHSGHVNLLKKCSSIASGGEVIVSLNTDEFIEQYKGSPPIYDYETRKTILESCKYVTNVIPNVGGSDSRVSILISKPDYIVVGSDWVYKDYYSQMNFTQEWLDQNNIGLIYVPYTKNISTTLIKQKI